MHLELSMLANGYSFEYVEQHLRQFFQQITTVDNIPFELHKFLYRSFRRQLFRTMEQDKRNFESEPNLRQNSQWLHLQYFYD